MRFNLLSAGACSVLLIALSVPVMAQTEREQQLETLVKQLLERVEVLEQRVGESETSTQELKTQVEEVSTQTEDLTKKEESAGKIYWKNKLTYESADGSNKFQLGGRLQNDWFTGSIDDGDFPDGTRFRRLYLSLAGKFYDDFNFRVQYDLSGSGQSKFSAVYMDYAGLDWFNVRIGQTIEPITLEGNTLNKYITFMERSPMYNLIPKFETGLMLYNKTALDNRLTWALGAFKNANNWGDSQNDDDENGDWDITGRLTGLPWYEDDGEKLLHLGVSGSHREWSDEPFRFRSRGSFSRGDYLVNTGWYDAESADLLGAETALVFGQTSLQVEYLLADVDSTLGGSETYQTYYIDASYFLTGEHRPYSKGAFSQLKPFNNFSVRNGGWGAWQIAIRYAHLDLDDTPVVGAPGGKLDDYTFALNWYLNPNARIMWNYVHSESDDVISGDQDADIFQMRFQYEF